MMFAVATLLAFLLAGGTVDSTRTTSMTKEKFNKWHHVLMWNNPAEWDGVELTKMCKLVSGSRYSSARVVTIKNQEFWLRHKGEIANCCAKESVFEKNSCFKVMRENFLDDNCSEDSSPDSDDQVPCCAEQGENRYQCFGDVQRRHQTTFTVSAPEINEDEATMCRYENAFFPEADVGEVNENEEKTTVCQIDDADNEEQRNNKTCKFCCRVGAYIGRRLRHVKGCPYQKCHYAVKIFLKRHKKCIKHPKLCAAVFVRCCVRQQHKDMYAPGDVDQDRRESRFSPIGYDPFAESDNQDDNERSAELSEE